MKYAILGDIHANVEALVAVLGGIANDDVDEIVCLGDIVGYNANPNDCVDIVRTVPMRCIAGNHDRAAIGGKDVTTFGGSARRAIEWTRGALTEQNREYLATLPSTLLVDEQFFTVHGALHPTPNDELHLSNDARVARSFEELVTGRFGSNVCFFGHNHRAVVYEQRTGSFHRVDGSCIRLLPDAHYLVNPGSVGQSRDGDWRAAYAVYDTDRSELELHRVPYDIVHTERSAQAKGLLAPEPWPARSLHWLEGRLDRSRDQLVYWARRWRALGPKPQAPSHRA